MGDLVNMDKDFVAIDMSYYGIKIIYITDRYSIEELVYDPLYFHSSILTKGKGVIDEYEKRKNNLLEQEKYLNKNKHLIKKRSEHFCDDA